MLAFTIIARRVPPSLSLVDRYGECKMKNNHVLQNDRSDAELRIPRLRIRSRESEGIFRAQNALFIGAPNTIIPHKQISDFGLEG